MKLLEQNLVPLSLGFNSLTFFRLLLSHLFDSRLDAPQSLGFSFTLKVLFWIPAK